MLITTEKDRPLAHITFGRKSRLFSSYFYYYVNDTFVLFRRYRLRILADAILGRSGDAHVAALSSSNAMFYFVESFARAVQNQAERFLFTFRARAT